MTDPHQLWRDVRNQIRGYSVINSRAYTDTRWEQLGGHQITVGDSIYNWKNSRNGETVIYRFGTRIECALLMVERDENGDIFGILQGISKGTRCAVTSHSTTKDLMRAVWKLAYQKRVQYIQLTDTSKLLCPDGTKLPLSKLYFIAHGKTWYQTLWPLIPSDTALVEESREHSQTVSWADIYTRLRGEAKSHFLPEYPGIYPEAPGSASAVVRYLKSQNWCTSIGKYGNSLVAAFNIPIEDVIWQTHDITGPDPGI